MAPEEKLRLVVFIPNISAEQHFFLDGLIAVLIYCRSHALSVTLIVILAYDNASF